ncbi:MAG: YbaK/EbsC family protein [candidate division NC10 bacterium]|nr:YbaK/EbsC family protein [candidate division NC10 bacterium]
MPTVEAAARGLGVSEGEIIKSLLFQAKDGGLVLAIAAGMGRINTKRLEQLTGLKGLRLAKPEVVLEATGYPAGGTPPVGHKNHLRVVVDWRVLELPYVYGGGGDPKVMMRIKPTDIIRLNQAKVQDIVD